MHASRAAGYRQAAQSSQQEDRPSAALPQPLLRLTAMASIGVGAGLFSASAPTEVLVLTFAPALIAMLVITVRSVFTAPEPSPVAEEVPRDVPHG